MARRVTDFAPLENRKLTLHAIGFFLTCGDDMQSADSFSVQTGVLRETLRGGIYVWYMSFMFDSR
jgi:hypothetical protein